MSHYVYKCEFGYVHAQCRCPDDNKIVRHIKCGIPSHWATKYYVPRHRLDIDPE